MNQSVYAGNKLESTDTNSPWVKLFDFVGASSSVLDIGCSSGNFGKELIAQKDCQVVGIDINDNDLKIAARHLTKALKRNIEHDDVSDLGMFDHVVMADVIEHLVDPVAALKKVKKLLKTGGTLVFSVPNMANIANRVELLGGRFEYTEYDMLDETHLHYYDHIELEKVLARAGFKVEQYNNTIRDVPRSVLMAQLEKLGLQANEDFLKMASNLDATSHQFIGVARPLSKSLARQTAKIRSKTPHDFLSQQFDEAYRARDDVQARLEGQTAKAKKLALAKTKLAKEKRAVIRELTAIKNSNGWRMLERLYTIKHGLKKALWRK